MARNIVRKYIKTQLLAAAHRRQQAEEEAAIEAQIADEEAMEANRYAGQPDVPHAL
jgi:hypothetical protein